MSFEITGLEETIRELEGHAKEPRKFISASKPIEPQRIPDVRAQRTRHRARHDERRDQRERDGHAYQNRSHSAEVNTLLLVVGDGSDADYRVEMNVEYASFLQNRNGKKWSRFDELAKAAFGDIDVEAKAL